MTDDYSTAKIDDMVKKYGYGYEGVSGFMNPAEQYNAEKYLKKAYPCVNFAFYGGYKYAERKKLYVSNETSFEGISCVKISGSGYNTLVHKDFMGALLALGLERSAVGDITVPNANEAVVFMSPSVSNFLLSPENPLEYIGNDKVKISLITVDDMFEAGRKYIEISGTISSPRLDCVIAEFMRTSRRDAKDAINSGLVRLNYTEAADADKIVCDGDVISVKGSGRFIVKNLNVNDKTRKDRIRFNAIKYV